MLAPFEVAPVLVEKPWGGTRLSEWGKYPGRAYFGESWEIADLAPQVAPQVEDPVSRVIDGRWRGWSLGALAAKFGEELMGGVPLSEDGRFPLLIKFIDAREHLSVQVHPTAAYTATHPGTHLKTESWYVVDADPGSKLFLDVDASIPHDRISADLDGVTVVPLLRSVPAEAGAFHHIPAGMIHALGAGVMVAEIQTPSDTTFRLYDWSGEYDREPRVLHADEARETIIPTRPARRSSPSIPTPSIFLR
jgi:mannose-6-phosphate isomerase